MHVLTSKKKFGVGNVHLIEPKKQTENLKSSYIMHNWSGIMITNQVSWYFKIVHLLRLYFRSRVEKVYDYGCSFILNSNLS